MFGFGSFICHVYAFFQVRGRPSSFRCCYRTIILLQPGAQTLPSVSSWLALSETLELEHTPCDLSHPSLPSSPTCRSRGVPVVFGKGLALTSSPLDSVLGEGLCWERACVWGAESREPGRAECPQQVSALHQHRRSRALWANWRKVVTELCRLPNTPVQPCSSERIHWVGNGG